MATKVYQKGNYIIVSKNGIDSIIPILNFDFSENLGIMRFKDINEKVDVYEDITSVLDEFGVPIGNYDAIETYCTNFMPLTSSTAPGGGATEAEQQAQTTELQSINTLVNDLKTLITTLNSTVATQTTLSALLTELQLKADLTETQPVTLPVVVRTPSIIVANGTSGTIAAGKRVVSYINSGSSDAVILGATIPKGVGDVIQAGGQRDTLGAITYDAQTSILIFTITE